MIFPKPLQEGDTVALLATSGPGDPARLQSSVEALRGLGLSVRVMESCRRRHEYLAGPDVIRIQDIHAAFADPGIKGLFVWRGGYGSQRLLPFLDYAMIRRNPKIFAGYSDVTALHTVFNQCCGLVTFHAPMMATEFCDGTLDPFTLQSFQRFIFETHAIRRGPAIMANPNNVPFETVVPGCASGILTGGNLSLISSSIGTLFEIDTKNKIIFLEDINEEPFRIDRMLLQLKQSGKFRDCAGIILGSFRPENVSTLKIAINDLLVTEGKPILANLACGHDRPTMTLPLGVYASMNTEKKLFNVYV